MRDGLNREWARLHSGESLSRYRITPFDASSDWGAARVYVAALDSIDVTESDRGIEFTTHMMLPVPQGWTLSKVDGNE